MLVTSIPYDLNLTCDNMVLFNVRNAMHAKSPFTVGKIDWVECVEYVDK